MVKKRLTLKDLEARLTRAEKAFKMFKRTEIITRVIIAVGTIIIAGALFV